MPTLPDLAKELNRPVVYLRSVLDRFHLLLPAGEVSGSVRLFLRAVVSLRALGVAEEALREVWELEVKLIHLLNADSKGSPTWLVDGWLETRHARRRLFLTRFDIGFDLEARVLQPGLNFAASPHELFSRKEMGEDALRMLDEAQALARAIRRTAAAEAPVLRDALDFARDL
jgi:hypothetical protein